MKLFTIIMVVTIAAFSAFAQGQGDTSSKQDEMNNGMMEGAMDGDMKSKDAMDGAMMSGEAMGPLMDFVDMADAQKFAELGPTVLFFYADWCPTCQSARADFEANSMDLDEVSLLVVNYDDSQDLQQKYGITYQHTFVQIDSAGNPLAKWNGGGTMKLLDELVN